MNDVLIKEYFRHGYSYNEILGLLSKQHGIMISTRTLYRILRKHGLYRKSNQSSFQLVIQFIAAQLTSSGSCIGYRQMRQRCVMNGFRINKNNVLTIMRELDPEGIELRKRNCLRRRKYYSCGPNWVWHIDGYDKLKPYGFSIHGAIDGYNRRVMWLKLTSSNKDPQHVCEHFIGTCLEINGIPRKVVGDRGTENVYLAASQRFLRRNHFDTNAGEKSFQYGRSVSNQRIESWWSMLRRSCTNWWINYFQDLISQGYYDTTDSVHIECMRFTHGPILATELTQLTVTWNSHRIRPSINHEPIIRPAGRPNVLYYIPEETVRNYKYDIDLNDIEVIRQLCCNNVTNNLLCSNEFFELATILMQENNFIMPKNHTDAFVLYQELLRLVALD